MTTAIGRVTSVENGAQFQMQHGPMGFITKGQVGSMDGKSLKGDIKGEGASG